MNRVGNGNKVKYFRMGICIQSVNLLARVKNCGIDSSDKLNTTSFRYQHQGTERYMGDSVFVTRTNLQFI